MIVTGTVDGWSALINRSTRKYAIWPENYLLIETADQGVVGIRHRTTGALGELVWQDILPRHKVMESRAWDGMQKAF